MHHHLERLLQLSYKKSKYGPTPTGGEGKNVPACNATTPYSNHHPDIQTYSVWGRPQQPVLLKFKEIDNVFEEKGD
jgi:hypothetical protein